MVARVRNGGIEIREHVLVVAQGGNDPDPRGDLPVVEPADTAPAGLDEIPRRHAVFQGLRTMLSEIRQKETTWNSELPQSV